MEEILTIGIIYLLLNKNNKNTDQEDVNVNEDNDSSTIFDSPIWGDNAWYTPIFGDNVDTSITYINPETGETDNDFANAVQDFFCRWFPC
jgi:hypothetical protein